MNHDGLRLNGRCGLHTSSYPPALWSETKTLAPNISLGQSITNSNKKIYHLRKRNALNEATRLEKAWTVCTYGVFHFDIIHRPRAENPSWPMAKINNVHILLLLRDESRLVQCESYTFGCLFQGKKKFKVTSSKWSWKQIFVQNEKKNHHSFKTIFKNWPIPQNPEKSGKTTW